MASRRVAAVAAALALLPGAAHAASGSLADPRGDGSPDIVKLAYNTDGAAVRLSLTFAHAMGAQDHATFIISWGNGASYSYRTMAPYSGLYYGSRRVRCERAYGRGWYTRRLTIVIPDSCIRRAPRRVRFQGTSIFFIVADGQIAEDETRKTGLVTR